MRPPKDMLELAALLGAEPGEPLPLGEPELLAALEAASSGRPAGPPGPRHATAAALLRASLGHEPPATRGALRLALETLHLAAALEAACLDPGRAGSASEARRVAALEECLTRAARALCGLPFLLDQAWILAPLLALGPPMALAA